MSKKITTKIGTLSAINNELSYMYRHAFMFLLMGPNGPNANIL